MIDPAKVCLFIPGELKKFKLDLFNRIGEKIKASGGRVIRADLQALDALPDEIIPIVGCSPELMILINRWKARGRNRIQWDRGYARRVFATWLPRAPSIEQSYYRWHLNSFQMQSVRDVPGDRWKRLQTPVSPWRKGNRHIVIAAPSRTYAACHCPTWLADTVDSLARVTTRQLVIRDKESKRDLRADLDGAHCLVAHGSIAAVESVIMGCPVFVHSDSAAALVGLTDLKEIERPIYPDRDAWLKSLAYCQFNETELVDGTLWKLMQ